MPGPRCATTNPSRSSPSRARTCTKRSSASATFTTGIVIDGTPRDDAITRSCLIAADIVVIPIEPSALSAWASDRTVGQVEEARIYRPDLQARIVISRKIPGTVLGREMRLLELPLPVLETEITQRVAFAESMLQAQSIQEYAPNSAAAREIAELIKELHNISDQ